MILRYDDQVATSPGRGRGFRGKPRLFISTGSALLRMSGAYYVPLILSSR